MSGDPQIEVDLLRVSVWPVGWDVVGRQLDPHPRLAVDQHHVPVVLGVDGATEHPRPEGALGSQVSCIEYDDPAVDQHCIPPWTRRTAGAIQAREPFLGRENAGFSIVR
jgi:hypothetical protein